MPTSGLEGARMLGCNGFLAPSFPLSKENIVVPAEARTTATNWFNGVTARHLHPTFSNYSTLHKQCAYAVNGLPLRLA